MSRAVAYLRPRSLDDLWAALEDLGPQARLSAGCTDLLPQARAGLVEPATWVDVRGIPELTAFDASEGELRLGAALSHHRVTTSDEVRRAAPALAAACGAVGSRQIRALGTLGGNAANASPCADSVLAMAAVGARAVLTSEGGSREVLVEDLAKGPGETVLEWGEIIEAFLVPAREGRRSVHLKLGPRRAHSVAKVSVGACADVSEGTLRGFRLFLGSVAPTVIRAPSAEATVEGRSPAEADLAALAAEVVRVVKPIDDVRSTARYRRQVSGALARRAVRALLS